MEVKYVIREMGGGKRWWRMGTELSGGSPVALTEPWGVGRSQG